MADPREIRVFLSSTFRDMDAERHHLVNRVFPKIRQLCYQRQVNFSEIDLRWGITEAAANNGRTVQICLEEIDRCRALQIPPFFIGFLGERYGWVPQADDLAAYWQQSPDRRYATLIQDALNQNISVTELEIRFAFLSPPEDVSPARVQMYLRDPALTATLAPTQEQPDSRLTAMKTALREQAPQTIAIDGYKSIEEFGDAVSRWLVDAIDTLYPAESLPDIWQQRRHEHACFADARRRGYVPLTAFRDPLIARFNQQWMSKSPTPTLIIGESGMGKSAFLADLETTLKQRSRPIPDFFADDYVALSLEEMLNKDDSYQVFSHYVGADGDFTLANWRNRLFHFLAEAGDNTAIASKDDEAWEQVIARLDGFFTRHRATLVLTLDAINQFSQRDAALERLSKLRWPMRILLVMTGTPDVLPVLGRIHNTLQESSGWHLEMLPPLALSERQRLCEDRLAQVSKSLSDSQMTQLIQAPVCNSPLFLHLTIEELCLHARHEALPTALNALLACTDPGSLFISLLESSDKDYSAPRLATRAACFIAASRRGLTHGELAYLLEESLTTNSKIADHDLVPLLARLAPWCQSSDGRLQLLHGILTAALQENEEMESCRERIIWHFANDTSGFALAERIWQWMALAEDGPVIRELSEVMSVIHLHETAPELLHQAWGACGIYLTSPLTGKSTTPFSWSLEQPDELRPHLYSAMVIFIWLRQLDATSTAAAWGNAIRPVFDDSETTYVEKAHFYNTLALLNKKMGNLDLAEICIDTALEYAGDLLLTDSYSRIVMNKLGIMELTKGKAVTLELYKQLRPLMLTTASSADLELQIAQLEADTMPADYTEARLRNVIKMLESEAASPQRQIPIAAAYMDLTAHYLDNNNQPLALESLERAIELKMLWYPPEAQHMQELFTLHSIITSNISAMDEE